MLEEKRKVGRGVGVRTGRIPFGRKAVIWVEAIHAIILRL
jgi:hypothetical protein